MTEAKCPKCREAIDPEALRCPHCRSRLRFDADQFERWMTIGGFVAVGVLVLMVVLYFFVFAP